MSNATPQFARTQPSAGRSWSSLVSLQTGHAAAIVAGGVSVVAASRILGPRTYGLLTLATAVAQYAMIFSVNWTSAATIRFGREEFVRTASVRNVFWARLALIVPCLTLVSAGMLTAADPLLSLTGLPSGFVELILLMTLVLTLADHTDGMLQATGDWNLYAWLATIDRSAFLVGLIAVGLLSDAFAVRAAVMLAIASKGVRILVGSASLLRAGVVTPPALNAETTALVARYSWPHIFTFTIGYFSAVVEPFLIKRYLGVTDVGVYQVAFQIALLSMTLLNPISTLFLPGVTSLRVQQREDVIIRLLTRLVPQFLFMINVALALAMGVATLLFTLIFGQAFSAGLPPLLILFVAVSFQAVSVFYSPLLAAYDLTRHSAALNTVGGLLAHLLPAVLLIPRWGMNGAAASWLIWYVCGACVSVWVISRRLPARTFSTLAYSVMPLAALAIFLLVEPALFRWSLLVILLVISVAWVRARRVFQLADLAMFEAIGMPVGLRRVAARAYAVL